VVDQAILLVIPVLMAEVGVMDATAMTAGEGRMEIKGKLLLIWLNSYLCQYSIKKGTLFVINITSKLSIESNAYVNSKKQHLIDHFSGNGAIYHQFMYVAREGFDC